MLILCLSYLFKTYFKIVFERFIFFGVVSVVYKIVKIKFFISNWGFWFLNEN